MSYRLGVDVGGTFTDLLLFDESRHGIMIEKVATTSANQAIGIVDGVKRIVDRASIRLSDITMFLHGTTAATNAILERNGAKTALITTKGFRDILHIMRQDRPKLYDFFAQRPPALVPRHLRLEVPERILYTGEIYQPLDKDALSPIVERIKAERVRGVAICLLHSYANPVHEKAVRDYLRRECPDLHVSISSEILPEMREYDRMSTTVINVYVLPIVSRYLNDLNQRLRQIGFNHRVHVMQSNGGIMPSSLASHKCVFTVLSGPAAGVLGGVALAKQAGLRNVITVDMGGTSFDICLAHQGTPSFTHQTTVDGHAIRIPMFDIHSIGAGGGSTAWIDRGGALRVGPHSAGADPGPVCYGKGGARPTVTDANLILGRLNPDFFLGGEMAIDADAARQAIEEEVARPLSISSLEAAEGIIKVVNAAMVKGIRYVSVERGHDPRDFGLVCFGGNGPLHAAELAEHLDIRSIMIPFAPGVNCAFGLMVADFRYDYVTTYLRALRAIDLDEINSVLQRLEKSAEDTMTRSGVARENVLIQRSLDVRYVGQGYELEVPFDSGTVSRRSLATVENRFHDLHRQRNGFHLEDEPTETVNIRIACTGIVPKPQMREEPVGERSAGHAIKGKRPVFLKGRFHDTPIYDRDLLAPGCMIEGPAIIEQKDSTTLLFPGNMGRIDSYRNIMIDIAGGR